MKATEILMSEHQVILRMISVLERAADRLEAGRDVSPEFFVEASNFIKGFADGCHHRKEEGVLFKAMAKNGMSETSGPIAVMLGEHEMGRTYNQGMRAAAQKLAAGDETAVEDIIFNARGYALLLTQHIAKENQILFPMADKIIPLAQQAAVDDGFEHVEHEETGEGIHEKYLALVDKLEMEISGFAVAE